MFTGMLYEVQLKVSGFTPLSERLHGGHGRIAGITTHDLNIQNYPEDCRILLALRGWCSL